MTVNPWALRTKAKELYPQSIHMQRQWLLSSVYLYTSDKHALQTGGWKNGSL